MCGISGIVYSDPRHPVAEQPLARSITVMAHRGPDDHGTFIAPGVGLASLRLSILDLSPRGHMPMQTTDGRYVICYNGEVYNYRELRRELCAAGLTFTSDTDTEVVLRLFERHGP